MSYSAIHLLEQNELGSSGEIFQKIDILMIFLKIFEIYDFFIKDEEKFKGSLIIVGVCRAGK